MTIYLTLMALVPLGAIIFKPTGSLAGRKFYVLALFILLVLVSAFRDPSVGNDTAMYCRAYQTIGLIDWSFLGTLRYEIGFSVLCKLLNGLSPDPRLMLAVTSVMIIAPVGFFVYKGTNNSPVSVFLYIAFMLYLVDLSMIRQGIAIGILLFGFMALTRKRTVLFFAAVLVACAFHSSALVFLLMYPLSKISFTGKTLLVYLAVSAGSFLFADTISASIARAFGRDVMYSAEFMQANYYGALVQGAFAFAIAMIAVNYHMLRVRSDEAQRVDSLYCHALMLWVLFSVLGIQVQIYSRLGFYFFIFAIVAVPKFLEACNSKERALALSIVCSISLVYFLVVGVFRPEWYGAIPYGFSLSAFS